MIDEVARQLRDCGATYIFTLPEHLPKIREAIRRANSTIKVRQSVLSLHMTKSLYGHCRTDKIPSKHASNSNSFGLLHTKEFKP